MKKPDFVAVDWGSTAFRAWAMTLDGETLDSTSSEDGLKSVTDRDFASVVTRTCGPWLAEDPVLPIVFSGMIGSRTGWLEAPYVECPVAPAALVTAAVRFRIDDHPAAILPGACVRTDDGDVDVMRGEELQLLGIVDGIDLEDALVCIPGTHSKWARLAGGALIDFRTFITGELFQLLRRQSLVGALADGDAFDEAAFRRGVLRGADRTLANAVFAARANALAGTLPPVEVSAYLSGVLIGSEIKAQTLGAGQGILLLATGVLAERYETALRILGTPSRMVDAKTATQAGLLLAARDLWFQDIPA